MQANSSDKSTRLNKYLAHMTGISRREADEAIAAGRVMINDTPAALGAQINDNDTVRFDKQVVKPTTYTYLAINKPAGYVCSRKQQGDGQTIFSLLPEEFRKLKTVGRLDRESSGLILLTDDGDFAQSMTHPRYVKQKVYEVTLSDTLTPLHQQMITDRGIDLADGRSMFMIQKQDATNSYLVTMHEGRNRQIRRTFAALGYGVTRLHRIQFGNYHLEGIAQGNFQRVEK